jgi:hypothetical protein
VHGLIKTEAIYIEIAQTEDRLRHRYISYPDGVEGSEYPTSKTTPIVWIKNAFYPNSPISSFGTYTVIPIHLAFIVQKPCDYVSSKDDPGQPNQQSPFYKSQMFWDGASEQYRNDNNITFGVAGQYLNNALVNEAVSPLVKKYKENKHFDVFTNAYL